MSNEPPGDEEGEGDAAGITQCLTYAKAAIESSLVVTQPDSPDIDAEFRSIVEYLIKWHRMREDDWRVVLKALFYPMRDKIHSILANEGKVSHSPASSFEGEDIRVDAVAAFMSATANVEMYAHEMDEGTSRSLKDLLSRLHSVLQVGSHLDEENCRAGGWFSLFIHETRKRWVELENNVKRQEKQLSDFVDDAPDESEDDASDACEEDRLHTLGREHDESVRQLQQFENDYWEARQRFEVAEEAHAQAEDICDDVQRGAPPSISATQIEAENQINGQIIPDRNGFDMPCMCGARERVRICGRMFRKHGCLPGNCETRHKEYLKLLLEHFGSNTTEWRFFNSYDSRLAYGSGFEWAW
eukprot:GHVU01091541.1.p1 GENE.GHVU01091541.1~~GHVU01091541.1.p1  ORF type:complete len:357 (-),score=41.05 GHVU01091541.1:31-1101(-)